MVRRRMRQMNLEGAKMHVSGESLIIVDFLLENSPETFEDHRKQFRSPHMRYPVIAWEGILKRHYVIFVVLFSCAAAWSNQSGASGAVAIALPPEGAQVGVSYGVAND